MDTTVENAWLPGKIDDTILRVLVEVSADGLALLDERGRILTLNAGAADILGEDGKVGHIAPFARHYTVAATGRDGSRRMVWSAPDGRRRDLEYRLAVLPDGRYAVWFSDVTESVRQQERLTAITRAVSSVADACSLRATLDAVANEILMTANISAVQILALEDPHAELRVLGMAGFGDAADFIERLSACRKLGARVRFVEALQARQPVVVIRRKSAIMADPAWAPLHGIMNQPDWDSFVSMPLVVRGRALGVVNAYYLPGEDPGPSSLAFLEAMADHAAVAIDTASLLAQTRSQAQLDERRRLARDLHDSVVQQVFSMGMQARALRAQLDHDIDPARVRRGAEELAKLSQSALADLRGLVFELRPLDVAERGLIEAVRAHSAGLEARTGLDIEVHAVGGTEVDVGIEVQEDLYRIVQEALHNVVKHAQAGKVEIRFRMPETERDPLVIEVMDNGRASGPVTAEATAAGARRGSLGLISMRERVERWGGRLLAGPRPAGGWAVEVTLPTLSGPC